MDIVINGVKNPSTITRKDIVSLLEDPTFTVSGLEDVPEDFTANFIGDGNMTDIELLMYHGDISSRPISSGLIGKGTKPKDRVTLIEELHVSVRFVRYTYDGVVDDKIIVDVSGSIGCYQADPLRLIEGGKSNET